MAFSCSIVGEVMIRQRCLLRACPFKLPNFSILFLKLFTAMYSQYKALKQMISVDQCKEKIADLVVFSKRINSMSRWYLMINLYGLG